MAGRTKIQQDEAIDERILSEETGHCMIAVILLDDPVMIDEGIAPIILRLNQYGVNTVSSCENYRNQNRAQIGFRDEYDAQKLYQVAYFNHAKKNGYELQNEGEPSSLFELLVNRCTVETKYQPRLQQGTTYLFSRRSINRSINVPTGELDTTTELYIPCQSLEQFWDMLQVPFPNPEKGKRENWKG